MVVIVRPETVIAWASACFSTLWTWKSRHRVGRPAVASDVRALIRAMSRANPLWDAPRIHGELLKLGIDVSQARATAEATAMTEVRTASRSPWQNGIIERFIGSVRRECLDHVIVFNARGLQRLLTHYVEYYQRSRTHLALARTHPSRGRSHRQPRGM